MTTPAFKDHFSTDSAGYAAHRPTYPMALVEALAAITPGHELAVDCACGSGQLTTLLAGRFQNVLGTDASATQIASAAPHDRITYRTTLAEDTGLPDHCADLITVAQAAHWLDLDKFYTEVLRIARPGAAIALITYGKLHIADTIDAVIDEFYDGTIGSYWPPERRIVESGYRTLPFPFEETQLPPLAIELHWRFEDLIAYLGTWSAVKAAEKELGPEVMPRFAEKLRPHWTDPATPRLVRWPLSLRVGHIRPA
ncbi:class I SAM-dependent methyltransferase [Luteolibacter ambystomatis]|uniref:Class I SAM-dependent methyltransferase n=1 Tax=Luteolibacter ambystomatis TaxID=2824561 RepID=A0A975PGQ7_9BACT|nr:class I SAM-dependent methyltransferase [Luteolibacter ambystomatis]QUE52974.1 class I SAM-dependent methyltransferase [Luteolibacter ambystomatis]